MENKKTETDTADDAGTTVGPVGAHVVAPVTVLCLHSVSSARQEITDL